jgi:hypothetical protein
MTQPITDTWITETEEIDVPSIKLNPETKQAEQVIEKRKVEYKAMYTNPVVTNKFCKDNEHNFQPTVPFKFGHFKCSKCSLTKVIDPTVHMIVNGNVVPRK